MSCGDVHKNACHTIHKKGIKCGPGICPPGTECCQEKHSNGAVGNVITCCAPGSCDNDLGLCSQCANGNCPVHIEGYIGEDFLEEKGCDCKRQKQIIISLILVCIVLGLGTIIIAVQK